jgi:hypothetical protein
MTELNEKQRSLLEATEGRPDKEILGVLHKASEHELEHFLGFDPEKRSNSSVLHGFDMELVQRNKSVGIDAQIIEVDSQNRYILRRYDKEGLYRRLREASPLRKLPSSLRQVTLSEAYGMHTASLRENVSWDNDTASGSGPWDNFTPLMMGPYYRQQYMYRMLEAKSKAYEAYVSNPIGHRIPQMISQFVLGKGVSAEFKDDRAQKLWDAFAKFNKLGTSRGGVTRAGSKLRTWAVMQSVDGESMFQFIDKGEMLKVNALDTATILEVVTDPADIEQVYYYHQQFATPYNMYTSPGIPSTRYIIRQIPANEVLHVKLNVFDNEKRGRSDLYSVLGWLKRVKDLINANVIKAYFQACYTWDYTIKGSPTAVAAFAAKNQRSVPTPGSSYIHNENVTRELISPSSSAGTGVEHDMMGLLNMISLGTGIPPVYLLGSMAQSRAAALTETEPSAKFFFERQSVWDEILHEFSERLFRWHYEKNGTYIRNTEIR